MSKSFAVSSVRFNPLAGVQWFLDPDSNARQQVEQWRQSRPADAQQLEKIASQAQADWFGNWSGNITLAVDARVSQISGQGALPILVAYNIPNRDCGGQSAGGSASGHAYRQWIRDFASGISTRRAVVILEPDALAQLGNCTAIDAQAQLDFAA